ncbi:hypothetical protein BD408DRAFT_443934 [Parasitella parasitica]|nr:hypothetical protein BD408DRAFT_443934 [Parasitella parasitica]
MSTQSFTSEDTIAPPVSSAPEPSRRYIQWKEEDIKLLLDDLELPGSYSKWRENKSGYSKRVGEQIFNNAMNHEAIKFKVRWLESRFKRWNEQLTSPDVENDQVAINELRVKMFKEFPYYDRCKPIFASSFTDSPSVHQNIAPAEHVDSTHKSNEDEMPILKPEPFHMINSASPPGRSETPYPTPLPAQQQEYTDLRHATTSKRSTAAPDSSYKKRRQNQHTLAKIVAGCQPTSSLQSLNSGHNARYTLNDHSDESRLTLVNVELELKKMDHQERMQEMKLEQLRLEIELEKLKRGTRFATSSPCIIKNDSN